MGLGVSALSKEEHGKTADFLLSKPVSRTKILTSKLFAALTALLGTNLVFTGATFAMANFITHGEASTQTLLRLCSTVLLIQLAFFCFGFLLSAVLPKVKSIVAVSLPTVFVFFIIGTLGAIIGNSAVRYLTPFKYYDLIALIDTGKYDTKSLLLEGALCCFSILPDHNYSASKTAEQHT